MDNSYCLSASGNDRQETGRCLRSGLCRPDDKTAETGYITLLHEHGFKVAAMALSDDSIPMSDKRLKQTEKLAIVMGNDGYGLPGKVIGMSDFVVKIPMAPGIDSLNVAAASAVALYAVGVK